MKNFASLASFAVEFQRLCIVWYFGSGKGVAADKRVTPFSLRQQHGSKNTNSPEGI